MVQRLAVARSKAAVDTLTRALALALEVAAHGIRVNAVGPGIIATEFHTQAGDPEPMRRCDTTEEVAQTIT